MNVASLELCKELYELSNWHGTYFVYSGGRITTPEMSIVGDSMIPAYDLGYLMRKLPGVVELHHYRDGEEWSCDTDGFGFENADTPEDAACKLAIELFKQGVLTNEGGIDHE